MDVLDHSSRKRQTYQVEVKYSILWECALGIAAVTNSSLIDSLDQSLEKVRKSVSNELSQALHFVEKENTWKALLQLLHVKDFEHIENFLAFLQELPLTDLKFYSLPFVGSEHQQTRKMAANGSEKAMDKLKILTADNPFFPSYIDFICNVDPKILRGHLQLVISRWYEEVVTKDIDKLQQILEIDAESKKIMKDKKSPEAFVEWATGGINYLSEPTVEKVLLIPQYIYRPWNIKADLEGTKVFYYPVSNTSITPDDRYTPSNLFVLKHKALADETRLRLVKLLNEKDRTLHELTQMLQLGKSTLHHHLKILRAAQLVGTSGSKYILKRANIDNMQLEMENYLT
ncbi:ArsR/SmtB family transcription factor [Sutcliffiella rhizosphaerae]|uniref:HTH arsR-type domain-containing protein n=1 Tax=Sutcliffiella rhizosphaerae TaxID=2880967 RepID=A0ABM8YP37_9BACI|nr:metalloregulator ArsR/SmtB family transcription factor [Sutcliffiella rhizosphaerae]CAG9621511.1 hypothetical protein BACCIP111883_02284 [Sutcliffiella rhizosphaerae]